MPTSDASLSALVVTGGTLTPAFNPSIQGYRVSFNAGTTLVPITVTKNDSGASISFAGSPITSGSPVSFSVSSGYNYIDFLVTASDGVTRVIYTVVIIVGPVTPAPDFTAAASAEQSADGLTLTLNDNSTYGANAQGYTTANFSARVFSVTDILGNPLAGSPVTVPGSALTVPLALIKDQMVFLVLNLTGQGGAGNYSTAPVKIPLDRITKNLYRNMLQQGCCANKVIDQRLAFADVYLEGCEIEALAGNAAGFNTDIAAASAYLNGPKF